LICWLQAFIRLQDHFKLAAIHRKHSDIACSRRQCRQVKHGRCAPAGNKEQITTSLPLFHFFLEELLMDVMPLVRLVDGVTSTGFLTCFGFFTSRLLRF
jgi:hypothetical protein